MKNFLFCTRAMTLSTLLLLLFSLTGFAFAGEIDDVRMAIEKGHGSWTAAETSISKLPQRERMLRVGLLKPVLTDQGRIRAQEDVKATASTLLSAPSGPFDWRNFGGTSYVTPVKDQGGCGSCWAFATTAALESYTLFRGSYTPGLNLAEQILVSCSGAGSCGGGYIDKASTFFQGTGLPTENFDPYTGTDSSCSIAGANWRNSTDKIMWWHWVATTAPTVAMIKNAVYTFGPLATTMNVYADFYSYRSGVYHYVSGSYQGGHAILITGYADNAAFPGGGYFVVKNSWGTGWGESGFFRIAYSELNSVVQFGHWTIAYDSTPPPPATDVAIAYDKASPQFAGSTVTFSAAGRGGTGSYEYKFWLMPPGGSWLTKQNFSSKATWSWNTTGLAPGSYQICVGVRTTGTNPAAGYDCYKIITYQINLPPAKGVTLIPNKTSPQTAGTAVTFSAAGSGGTGSYVYLFKLLPPGGAWTVKQGYAATATWAWNTSGLVAGTYSVGVWVKTAGSSPSGGYDAYKVLSYVIR